MALLTKKKDKKVEEKSPVAGSKVFAQVELAMAGETQLQADDKSEFCFATFQTDKPLPPEQWVTLARAARSGYNFTLVVTKNEDKTE